MRTTISDTWMPLIASNTLTTNVANLIKFEQMVKPPQRIYKEYNKLSTHISTIWHQNMSDGLLSTSNGNGLENTTYPLQESTIVYLTFLIWNFTITIIYYNTTITVAPNEIVLLYQLNTWYSLLCNTEKTLDALSLNFRDTHTNVV